jgi:hypothetical protein
MRDSEQAFHRTHTNYNFNILREVNYCESESLYMKKQIVRHVLRDNVLSFAFSENDELILMSFDGRGRGQGHTNRSELRKLNIQVVLDKDSKKECSDFGCAICLDTRTSKDGCFVLSCKHEFCGTCMNEFLNDYRSKTSDPACALCRGKISGITVKHSDELEDKNILENLTNMCVSE